MNYNQLRIHLRDQNWVRSIEKQTSFLDELYKQIPIRQRLYHINQNRFSPNFCCACGNRVNWSIKNQRYSQFCSKKCSQNSLTVRTKTEQTCLKRYGETTNLKTQDNKQKQQQTLLKKYGVENIAKSEHFKKTFVETCMHRYGVSNPSKLDQVNDKTNQTNFERYNRKRKNQTHIPLATVNMRDDRDLMLHWFKDLKMPVSSIAKLLNVGYSQLCVHFKNNLDIDITRHAVSSYEHEIVQYLHSLGLTDISTSVRTIIPPKELDIVIESKKLAIEINGLAWHSEQRGKHQSYHRDKMLTTNQNGYRLVQIWTSEWDQQRELVKSRLRSILGINDRVYARNCNIVTLSAAECSKFLDQNHMQKSCPASIRLALVYQESIVAVMTLGKSRYSKQHQWELIRYCSVQGVNVIGGAGKLFRHFVRNFQVNNVVSYCDLRWNTGALYQQLGFEFTHISDPNYWYTRKYTHLESRIAYQKHKLGHKLDFFDQSLTEWQNMVNNGYDRVWDCGNSVWVWKNVVDALQYDCILTE